MKTNLHITEYEYGIAQELLRRDREQQLTLDEFDANVLHTVIHAFNNNKRVKEDIGEVLYRINRKFSKTA